MNTTLELVYIYTNFPFYCRVALLISIRLNAYTINPLYLLAFMYVYICINIFFLLGKFLFSLQVGSLNFFRFGFYFLALLKSLLPLLFSQAVSRHCSVFPFWDICRYVLACAYCHELQNIIWLVQKRLHRLGNSSSVCICYFFYIYRFFLPFAGYSLRQQLVFWAFGALPCAMSAAAIKLEFERLKNLLNWITCFFFINVFYIFFLDW